MTKAILLTVCVLSISGFTSSKASEREPNRAPGMMKEEGGRMGPPPMDRAEDLTDIKFEFDTKNDLFKNADEAKEFQALFDKYKTSKEITDHFTKVTEANKTKMDDMRKSGKRPDFSKMEEERAASKLALYKEIKTILEKKKKDNIAAVALNEDVKCGGGKNPPVIEKATTDSMKDSAKVAKIILTEEELVKMKKEMKEEIKKEMMKEMADNKPKDMDGERGERPSMGDKPKMSNDEEGAPKMAEGKMKKGGRAAGGMGAMGSMGGGQDASTVAMFSSQMSGMGQMQMGGSQMMGNSQMNSQMNAQGSQSNQMTRDQMIQNAIRVPTMNFNQQFQYQNQNQMMGQNQMMPQMNQQQMMPQMNQQMRRPPQQQMNQNYGYQNYGYQANYQMNAYQSNVDQNYYGSMNSQYGYNLVAPQLDYGYTGSNSMMPATYSGQNYQYQQAAPSYSQYSFMGY